MKFKNAYPKCFESLNDYRAWRKASRIAYPRFGPCTDCTPGFQSRMKVEGRCEHPQIKFKVVEDGIEGFLPGANYGKGCDAAAGDEQGGGCNMGGTNAGCGKNCARKKREPKSK